MNKKFLVFLERGKGKILRVADLVSPTHMKSSSTVPALNCRRPTNLEMNTDYVYDTLTNRQTSKSVGGERDEREETIVPVATGWPVTRTQCSAVPL